MRYLYQLVLALLRQGFFLPVLLLAVGSTRNDIGSQNEATWYAGFSVHKP